MKLQIDNLDGSGPLDYSSAIEATRPPAVTRRLNRPSELRVSLVAEGPAFVVPVNAARITFVWDSGQDLFTGYVVGPPSFEYLGWGESGPSYRYDLIAQSDEVPLDRRRLPDRTPFVARSAGGALRQLTQDLIPSGLDLSGVGDLDVLPYYSPTPQLHWSEHAAEIALLGRAGYRMLDNALSFSSLGTTVHALDEADPEFSPEGLKLQPSDAALNDVTVMGRLEPQANVRDYFVGDGFTLRFYLSQVPFTRRNRTIFEEEYKGSALNPAFWELTDPSAVVTVSGGQLQIAGGAGTDGQTTVNFAEKIELGGAQVLQHGEAAFTAASDGVLGGVYVGEISVAGCLAGFRLTPAGAQTQIQALISGSLTGPVINTVSGHRYVFSTRFYATEIYRKQQIFHSAARPAGNGRGGADLSANVRVVLEVHEIDPASPASLVAPSTVLYDGIITSAPGFCTYALINAADVHCAIAFTRLTQAVDTEVRSALPGQAYRTRLVGSLGDGAECLITSDPALQFFPQDVPAANELIEVRYRGRGRAIARITNPAGIAAHAQGSDDGVRAVVRGVKSPAPRTAADCENAALALLDGDSNSAWAGEYTHWSDFFPGSGQDVFPGDGVAVNAPSRGATFAATVREVEIQVHDLQGEHCAYKIRFADDSAAPLAFEFDTAQVSNLEDVTVTAVDQVGATFIPDLTSASITEASSTTVTLDAGSTPPAGGGFEVRRSDTGWGPDNDRNLVGRFSTQSFTVPRLSRVQDFFLRPFDSSAPPKYSRYSAALHLDYPL